MDQSGEELPYVSLYYFPCKYDGLHIGKNCSL